MTQEKFPNVKLHFISEFREKLNERQIAKGEIVYNTDPQNFSADFFI